MKAQGCNLPEYPCTLDMWDALASEKRPIVIYGMGNGADKLFSRLEKYNVIPADVFASEGFVRGHSFRGIRVKSFSEIKETYSDFVILLSFATSRDEVLELLSEIDNRYDMYIPDMPVAGEEYFDRDFYNAHYDEILAAYNILEDDGSREVYAAIISYKLTGRMKHLEAAYCSRDELYALIGDAESIIDVGAYNGDTLREAMDYFPSLARAVAIEPDAKTFKRLLKFTDTVTAPTITAINAAAWSESGEGRFISSGNRNSSINSTSSFEHRDTDIALCTVDSLGLYPNYIKYDVEGAEREALIGTHDTIERCRPTLLVSLYHRSADIFSLPLYLKEKYPFYRLSLRRLRCVPAWEIDLILKACNNTKPVLQYRR